MDEILSRLESSKESNPTRRPPSPANCSPPTSPAGTPCSPPATCCTSSFPARSRSAPGRRTARRLCSPSWAHPTCSGELSVFDPGPRTSSATTITEVRAVSMDRDALRTWIADLPEIAEQLLRVLARRLRRTNNNLADLIFTDVPGRVAKLLQLAQRFGTQDDGALRVTHKLTQEEMALASRGVPRNGQQSTLVAPVTRSGVHRSGWRATRPAPGSGRASSAFLYRLRSVLDRAAELPGRAPLRPHRTWPPASLGCPRLTTRARVDADGERALVVLVPLDHGA